MIATITLNPSIDQHLLVPQLIKDDANRATEVTYTAGGKGLNVSKVIRELGGDTVAYTLLGGFAGEYWKHLVKDLDIAYKIHKVQGQTRINAVFTDLKDSTQTRVSSPGPEVSSAQVDLFLKSLCRVRPIPSFWVIGGSPAKGMSKFIYKQFITALQKKGTPCILDADGEYLKYGVQAKPFAIKPNEFEMQRLMGRRLSSIQDYYSAAKEVLKSGVSVVIVSLGVKGALYVSAADSFWVRGLHVKAKSKVGAGDSLVGGFVFGLSKKLSLRQSAILGVAASASAVMREAPRLCLRSDMASLTKKVRITDL